MTDTPSRYSPEDRLAVLLETAATTVARLDEKTPDHYYASGRLAGVAEALSALIGVPAYDLAIGAKARAALRAAVGPTNGSRAHLVATGAELRREHATSRRQA